MTMDSRFGGARIYEDRKLPCWECGSWFSLLVPEQKKRDAAGLAMPKTCPPCRQKRIQTLEKRP